MREDGTLNFHAIVGPAGMCMCGVNAAGVVVTCDDLLRRYVAAQQLGGQMEPKDLSKELWREYEFGGRVYRIESPQQLWIGTTTHRVLDGAGVVHCCPSPGQGDCVLRWKPRNEGEPVQF